MESDAPHGRARALRISGIALAALIPIIPIVVGIVLVTSGGPGTASTARIRPLASAPVAPSPSPAPGATGTVRARPRVTGATVGILRHATQLRSRPGGAVIAAQPLRTPFDSPVVLLVRRSVPGWFGVLSPLVGNGRLGWIPRSAVELDTIHWQLEVSLSHRQVTVRDNGRVVKRYTVAIGMPAAPTPTGVFAVTDRLQTNDPSGPYGCCILALSALAPHVIQGWSGGNRIAIHSTPETSSIGLPVSHGCLRLTLPEGRWLIEHVPLGTPTFIRT